MAVPTNITPPSIIGDPIVGVTVDADPGTWSDGIQVAGTGLYELADDNSGTNATGPLDVFPVQLVSGYIGMFIRVNAVQFENVDGSSLPVDSSWVGPIENPVTSTPISHPNLGLRIGL